MMDQLNKVPSGDQPWDGQEARSSENFTVDPLPGTSSLKWTVLDLPGNEGSVRFSVSLDIEGGTDEVFFANLAHGSETGVRGAKDLYISSPSGAAAAFRVLVEGVR